MIQHIVSKLLSESLLSLYPIFVKNIGLPLEIQLWSRFFSFVCISVFFANSSFLWNHVFSGIGLLLSFITSIHILTTYLGFQRLESGIAYSVFYMYPLFIQLIAYQKIHPMMFVQFLGVLVLSWESYKVPQKKEDDDDDASMGQASKNKDWKTILFPILMVLVAALTEALIYFTVRRIKTDNPWNHIFISYCFGAIVLSIFNYQKIMEMKFEIGDKSMISLGINIFIGLFGYLLRFYSMSHIGPFLYSSLSYFGIVMAFFYGWMFQGDAMTLYKTIGTCMIVLPNFWYV
jgi:drug/metabolite transporter (DMT)-like permease